MPVTKDKNNRFRIVCGHVSTSSFIAEVQEAADANKNALGFLPKSVFNEFARRDNLCVLTEESLNGPIYAGHLLFERRFPRAHIIQMFISQQYRRNGLATKLIDHLKSSLTQDGFTSIYARVADDLNDANGFWDKQGFYVQRVEKGGVARGRHIIVRCHELESPQLFPTSGINPHNPLGLQITTSDVVPMFLLDLNVLFDLAPRRPRHDDAISLFQAERMSFCRLAISNEIREELQRTAHHGKTDPMEAYLNIFPSFPISKDTSTNLIKDLALMIFPSKKDIHLLNANELSDLRHVLTVIQHNLAGLITNDEAILNAAPKITSKYGIEIVSPTAFRMGGSIPSEINTFEVHQETTLDLQDVSQKHERYIQKLLVKLGISGSEIASGWLPATSHTRIAIRRVVWDGNVVLGYLTWSAKEILGTTVARIAVDETAIQASNVARVLLVHLLEELSQDGPRQVRLEFVARQSLVRDLAVGFGFRGTPEQYCMGKLILGRVLTVNAWNMYQAELSSKGGLKLPPNIPVYRSADQHIRVLTPDGNQTHVKLDVLESLLSPALLCLPGRPAVIAPVQRPFSEPLLGHSHQISLLPAATASLFHDRYYLSHQRTLKCFKKGTIIFFYESKKYGGRGAIVALARVREAYLKSTESLREADLRQSVVTKDNINRLGKSKVKTVTIFDNIFQLPHHVQIGTLHRIGCGRPIDLISTRVITDDQSQAILMEAFSECTT
jgi:GNAT superfamily N-acetyltransferase/predicted nucleic acid-binding protein